jgi:rhamnosyltransferase
MSDEKLPDISVIIRTRNEAKQLDSLLNQIAVQADLPSYEILLIDNESSDNIEAVAKKHHAKLFRIADQDFTYPKAWNIAVKQSTGKFLVFLSAHAQLPHDQHFNYMLKSYNDDKIAGVYGTNLPMPDAGRSEKTFYRIMHSLSRIRTNKVITKARPGVFGTSNASARGDLIRKTLFDESFAAGGEDEEWARTMLEQGYVFVRNDDMGIHHSHYLSIANELRQMKYWFGLGKPKEFNRDKINRYRTIKY